MKTAAKIFVWIGMILNGILIFPIVVGVFALQKLDEAQRKEELQTIGWLTLLFCSLLGGIFILCMTDFDLVENKNYKEYNDYNDDFVEQKNIENKSYFTQINNALYIVLGISILNYIFSLIPAIKHYDILAGLPLILNSIIVFLTVIVLISHFYIKNNNNYVLKVVRMICIIAVCFLFIAELPINIVCCYDWAYYMSWVYWLCFVLSLISLIFVISIIVMIAMEHTNKNITHRNQNIIKNKNDKLENFETEMNKVKSLYEKQVITDEEYKKIRESIINKYYK